MQTLSHLRDFLDDEALRFMPGNLLTGQFILLREHMRAQSLEKNTDLRSTDEKSPKEFVRTFHTKIHIFDQGGTFIGTINDPEWYPEAK